MPCGNLSHLAGMKFDFSMKSLPNGWVEISSRQFRIV